MITKSDLNINNKSYTHKDFYQIYPELTEMVNELTNLWDAEATNESDPGVVLLKIAAFVADKLNYNIDKNILEAFITSATQETAVRKICDMLGYNIKYYNSATTPVGFMWVGDDLPLYSDGSDKYIKLDRFSTVITNDAKDINFILTEDVVLHRQYETVYGTAIQGEYVELDINDNGILLASNIDDKNRFYLPETQIAENGIWIFNNDTFEEWTKVDNLNTQLIGTRVWKFGYDSTRQLPYIEFPKDYVNLFKNGLLVGYIRTSGNNGNIKANTLTALVNNSLQVQTGSTLEESKEVDAENNLVIKNLYATLNGCNIESIDDAYQGFKKTVGTFDTLTTCRDYANAIYNMIVNEKTDNTPLVSNCQVSDIRDDLNRAKTVVKLESMGVTYTNVSDETPVEETVYVEESGSLVPAQGTYFVLKPEMTEFDLYLYPLNPIKNAYNKSTYIQSFKPLTAVNQNLKNNVDSYSEIYANLKDYKTISHVIKHLDPIKNAKDLYLLKNYYKLKAKIITKNKVNKFEQTQIKENIYEALYENFNARKLDYGEEIPYDRLLSIMENADARIKTIALDEPEIYSNYMLADGTEGALKFDSTDDKYIYGNRAYQNMLAKNILGGRIPLFNYNKNIEGKFSETNSFDSKIIGSPEGNSYYHGQTIKSDLSITYADTDLCLDISKINDGSDNDYNKLKENETIKIISPKILTEVTYPMYVNYAFFAHDPTKDIPKNTNYPLDKAGDELYIEYGDDDDKIYAIKYYYDTSENKYKQITWIDGVEGIPEDFSGLIYTTFNLMPTNNSANTKTRTIKPEDNRIPSSGWSNVKDACKGMISLKTSEEIAIKYINKAAIKQQAYIYWLTNNNNTITFNQVSGNLYEYILDAGEYLFYTNQAKTDLITLGSGTKLNYYATAEEMQDPEIIWSLNSEQSITVDDVAQNGIGAFANNNWIIKNWDKDNYLETQQMDIISISKGDILTKIELKDDEDDEITSINSSKWYDLKVIEYKDINEDGDESNKKIEGNDIVKYQIKPILNLNFGPDKLQKLVKDRNKVTLYTSGYKLSKTGDYLKDTEILDYLKSDPSKLLEDIYEINPLGHYPDKSSSTGIKANISVEKSGGTKVSLHTSGLNYSIKDNLMIYPLFNDACQYVPVGSTIEKTFDPDNGIYFDSMSQASLPIYIPEKNYALFTLYWNTNTDASAPKITGENIKLGFYPECITDSSKMVDGATGITLKHRGLSIIKIEYVGPNNSGDDSEAKIIIEGGDSQSGGIDVDGSLVHLDIKLVNDINYGLATDIFDLTGPNGEISDPILAQFFNDYIKDYSDFYATVDIDNNMLLDIDKMSNPQALFSYNNEINKFVISELDVNSFADIEIASSSKL